ncbi:MAG: extracellular solute-binding protein, partial [Glutamicibacter sp.]
RLSMVLALMLVLSMGTAVAEGAPTVVKMLVPTDHLEFLEQLMAPFNASQSEIVVEIDGTATGWDGVATKLITMLAGGEPVDIAAVSTSYYPQFAALGQLLDITEHAKATYSEEEYYWSVFEGLMLDGKLYGVPISVYTLMNYINKDMYDAKGVAYPSLEWGEKAWTFEDWQKAARELSEGEGLDRKYGAWVEYQLERTAAFIFPEGLNYWGEGFKPQFDNPRIREIHNVLYGMLHDELLMPNSDLTTTTGIEQLFADGKVANFITGTWSHTSIASAKDLNFGVAPTPGGVTVGYVDVYLPLASTKNPEATMAVLDYLISYDACVMKYENDRLGPQVNKKATEACKAKCFSGLTAEEVDCVFASLDNCQPLTVFPQWGEFLTDSLLPASKMMAVGEYTVDEAFDILQEQANMLLGF